MPPYVKTTWVDDEAPAITAAQLNRMETGIDEAVAANIDYANPTAANSTATISPTAGQYFTSTSALVTLTSLSGTAEFQPGTETSRLIWGTGAGAAITLTINPTNLVAGNTFSISLEGGESRVLMYDGTDFLKVGGVEIPMEFDAHLSANQSISVTTFTKVNLNVALINKGTVFDTVNYYFQPKRQADWLVDSMYSAGSTGAINRTTSRMIIEPGTVLSNFFGDVYPDAATTTGKIIRSPGATVHRDFLTTNQVYLGIFIDVTSPSGEFAYGGSISGECRMSGKEIVPW